MSIYPVKLASWYKESDDKRLWESAKFVISQSTCAKCHRKIKPRDAVGMHSVPWGYYTDELWCTWKCYDKWRECD